MNTSDIELAKADILAYLTSCGTKWFQARHTSKSKVVNNDALVTRAAQEHIRNMELTNMGRTASAKSVCDEELTTFREFK